MPNVELKEDHLRFRIEVARRKITRLVHFTPAINLLSIFEQGALLSRNQLKQLSVRYPELHLDDYIEINDKLRLDQMEDHLNISIQHPNHLLFKRFRDKCRSWCDSWCVLSLSPSSLYLKDTKFSIGNAASGISKRHGIDGTYDKFVSLFQEKVMSGNAVNTHVVTRSGTMECYTTDPQAEILVRERVPISEIDAVYFETEEELKRSKGAITMICSATIPSFVVDKTVFQQRGS